MDAAEVRKALLEKMGRLNEEQLLQVDHFVDSIGKSKAKEYDLLPHVENIVKERDEVLKKLAK